MPSNRPLRFAAVLATALACSLGSAPAGAQNQSTVYKWVDENGKLHYGQTLPPEYKDLAHERLNESGTVVDRANRTLTAEERRVLRAQEAVTRKRQTEEEVREKKDRLLLAAYRSEEDIRKVMDGELSVLTEQQELVKSSLRDQRNSLRDLVAQAADYERVGKPVPGEVKAPIENIQSVIVRQRTQLERLQEQLDFSRKNYEQDLARYRELSEINARVGESGAPASDS